MHFIYSLINFLILAAILWIFARKLIFSIFTDRAERLNRELDEAERIEAEDYPVPVFPEEHEVRTGSADVTGRICVIGAQLNEEKLAELFGF